MKSLTQNHAFAQVECVFSAHTSTHFDCILSKYAVYPQKISIKTSLNARGFALSIGISNRDLNTLT
jgi:hypothetical protein